MERFNELLEKRRNLTADVFEEKELIEISKTLTEQQLIGVDKKLFTLSHDERLDNITSLLDKFLATL